MTLSVMGAEANLMPQWKTLPPEDDTLKILYFLLKLNYNLTIAQKKRIFFFAPNRCFKAT